MWSTRIFTFIVCFMYRLAGIQGQALVFDVLRNSSAVGPNDTCASLACFVKEGSQTELGIQHVISLIISETSEANSDRRGEKYLAGLSLFDTAIHVYGDPITISGTGQRWLKGGELHVNIKGDLHSCQYGVFSCELRFIDSQNKGHIIKVDKKMHISNKTVIETENRALNTNTLNELKVVISDEMSKISQLSENLTSNVETAVNTVNQHLLRLEGTLVGDMQSRLDAIDKKLSKFEMIFNENITSEWQSLLINSIESIKHYIHDKFDIIQNQITSLEVSVRNRSIITDNLINESSRQYSNLPVPCEGLPTNLSTTISQVQHQLSSFTNEVIDKISKTDRVSVSARLPNSLWKLLLEWRSPPAQRKAN